MSRFGVLGLTGALLFVACGEGSTGPESVDSVRVSPATLTIAVGQTASLAGAALGASGAAVADAEITWESSDPAIASVDATGTVTGVASGTTSVTATADGISGSASVTVLPAPVETVDLAPAQSSLLPGETVQLTATLRDLQDNVLTGRPIEWLSNDVTVATVDTDGLVTAVAPGDAIVFATSDGRSGEATIDVANPNAAVILSIAPAELVEGQAASITGANFSATAAENVVTVNGVRAVVTGGNETSLDIVVPMLDCKPRHLAEVAVTVGADTDQMSHPTRPASFFALDQGDFTLLQDPSAYCLQFDATAQDEEYLIGVQSTVEDPASQTLAQVTAEADPGAPAAQVATFASPAALAPAPLDTEMARMLEWRAREAEIMHREVEMARSMPRSTALAAPSQIDPPIPPDVTVGTPVTLRYPDLDANTCSDFTDIQGTVRHVGTHAIWVSDDENPSPAAGYSDDDYQTLGDQFDADLHPAATDYFGPPSDEDANGRIVVVVTKEVNDDEIGGVVPSANLFPREGFGSCASSNEGEYFFMFAPDPQGEYQVGPIDRGQALNAAPSIIGHEFVHNIHLSRRWSAGNGLWDSWMHEGQATLGEEILGHALNGRGPGQNFDWAVVDNDPVTADRAWYRDSFVHLALYYGWGADGSLTGGGGIRRANAPEGCTWIDTPAGNNAGVCANRGSLVYGVSWSFLRWLTDHFAADLGGEAAMHTAWIDGASGGFQSLETLAGQPIEALLARWAASLYLDDRVAMTDPLVDLPSYDLLDIEENLAPEAHLEPRAQAFGDFTQGVQIRGASAAYFLVSGADRPSTAVRVRAPSGGFLGPSIQVWVARVR